ncbi:hypothetical protein PG985_009577 [Apiospora marii]|uniref:Uncharacterized protein n=1 Tax=Apiospora marii TaxID=335849 RepID=A0ABR1RFP6_9PEZI
MQLNISVDYWTAPDWGACHFGDCSLWAKFADNIYRHNDLCAADPVKMHRYLASGLPPYYKMPTQGEASIWYQLNCNSSNRPDAVPPISLIEHMLYDLSYNGLRLGNASSICRAHLASEIGLQGNSDIAGTGATLSYLIEAVLATAYLTAQAVAFFCRGSRIDRTWVQHSHGSVRDALGASLSTFFWASVLLSLGILTGSLHHLAAISRESVEDQLVRWSEGAAIHIYDPEFAVMASTFCCPPVFSMGLLVHSRGQRRRLLHVAVMMSAAVLMAVTWSLYLISAADRSPAISNNPSGVWIEGLPIHGPVPYAFSAGIVMFAYLGVPGLLTLIVAKLYRLSVTPPNWGLSRRYKMSMGFMTHIFCLGIMWYTLFRLWKFRGYIDTGQGSSIAEWSFGQILALATWVPVLVEFGYTFFFGIQEGLEGNMPTEYKAMLNGQIAGIAALSTDSLACSQA